MKTAISVPDEVFQLAEALAHRMKKSRSQLYCDAMREYLARHDPDEVTAAMDAVCEAVEPVPDRFVAEAARRVLAGSEW